MSLPGNIIYGLLAFAPLGEYYAGKAIMAGMYASVFAGFFASFFGSVRGMIYGPRAPTALVVGSVIGQLLASGAFDPNSDADLIIIVTLGLLTVFASGVIQVIFGLFKIGNMVKFISFPVIAGILNGTTLIIIQGAVGDYLGLPGQTLRDVIGEPVGIKPLSFLVALTTTLLWLKGEKIFPKIPGAILSIAGGTGLYYLLVFAGFGEQLSGTIGHVPTAYFSLDYIKGMGGFVADKSLWQFLPLIVSSAFIIAILSSIESLLAILTMQNLTNQRGNVNRELIAQGIGNMLNAFAGAVPASGASARAIVNFKGGGRTRLSSLNFSLINLLLIVLFASHIGSIPKAVTAGMAFVVAYTVLDKWSIKLIKEAFRRDTVNRHELTLNIIVILLVTITAVTFSIISAAVLGIILSVLIFAGQMSTSIIRNIYSGSNIRSKKQRYIKIMEQLNSHGEKIAIIELEGTIFFGATDRLINKMDELLFKGVSFVILDMKRVNRIDLSGVRTLEQTWRQMNEKGIVLLFAYLYEGNPLLDSFKGLSVTEQIDPSAFFEDTDHALEECEDRLLAELKEGQAEEKEFRLQDFLSLEEEEEEALFERFLNYVEEVHFEEGNPVFSQGDPGDAAYIIVKGSAEIAIRLPGANRQKRLSTLTYGTIFGEMALLDRGVRSAAVIASEELTCYKISIDAFDMMKQDDPQVAMVIMDRLSKVLVSRLRQSNATISELER